MALEPYVVPPVLLVLFALLAYVVRPRLIHPAGLVVTAGALAYAALVPADYELSGTLFGSGTFGFAGFDVVFVSVDPFSRLMGLIFAFIGFVAVLYSWSTDAPPTQTAYALAYVASSLGAVFAGDWLLLLFFWEVMAITSTLLVWHHGGAAVRAGFRYAVWHGIGGSLLMAAVIWHYQSPGVGTFVMTGDGIATGIPQVLAALGIGINVAFVGFHAWLPDTYPRPHIAASVFLCVYTTKTGVYALFRAFPEGNLAIAYMGGAMAVFGATFALLQSDMRRLLSYHIQSQVGYMVAGVGIGSALATAGAFGHVFNHILYKALLFMTVGVVIYRTGAESLDKIHGMRRAMPITFLAFTIAALSIAGFPGFNGFVSKGMVLYEAHHYPEYEALWYLLLLGGVGTFMSFIKLGYYVFFYGEQTHDVERASAGQSIAMLSVAALCVFYGVYPDALVSILPRASAAAHYHVFDSFQVLESFVLAATGLFGFVLVKGPLSRVGRIPDIDLAYNPLSVGLGRGSLRAVNRAIGTLDRASTSAALGTISLGSVATSGSSTETDHGHRDQPTLVERGLTTAFARRAGIGAAVILVLLATTLLLALGFV
ncbi:monovalent cation/H+ antiporter subunit D [Halovivax asiaticus JCM 14624]|uniref:Monovalent cation/H+ antiporter subunit D n=1 Tax=Halovivax asiaticus JCM 14624 TaxID=1227490 RepID=M0BUX3_9EURY|nr:Na(+)/H(+) antiporter subunit D [Halovivax asiaticus]ELZ14198.1 monovalent cation/H+ antiporter subunit D [Halovivax asiaticus JCM 14624]